MMAAALLALLLILTFHSWMEDMDDDCDDCVAVWDGLGDSGLVVTVLACRFDGCDRFIHT